MPTSKLILPPGTPGTIQRYDWGVAHTFTPRMVQNDIENSLASIGEIPAASPFCSCGRCRRILPLADLSKQTPDPEAELQWYEDRERFDLIAEIASEWSVRPVMFFANPWQPVRIVDLLDSTLGGP